MSRGRLIVVGGGQSGLAAARAGRENGWEPVVLEAGQEPVGSWPQYYDSLRLFSPRRYSAFPGHPFPGDPDGYPGSHEVVDYFRGYARVVDAEIRTGARVVDVASDGPSFAVELADHAETSLAVRDRVRFAPQTIAGRDLHWWLKLTRADLLPPSVLKRIITGTPVIGTDKYRTALEAGRPDQRPMFAEFASDGVVWPDGSREKVDTVIFATGYRPHLPYLRSLGVLDETGMPTHDRGLSTQLSGLAFLGLEFQRSFSSNTVRGVHRDAGYVVAALARQPRGAVVA